MKVDFLAREVHHVAHARAIYTKMPVAMRGQFATNNYELVHSPSKYVAVFSYGDLKLATRSGKRIIFGEHGVGMYYNEEHPSYAGSLASRDRVMLRLSPNETHAAKERETFGSGVPVEIIGVPKMDEWASRRNKFVEKRDADKVSMKPTVAVSFHWDCMVCNETRSAYEEFLPAIEEMHLNGDYNFIGHGHPRIMNELRWRYRTVGMKVCADFRRVLKEADIYVCDNSSTLFEFAYMRKPVVLMNSQYYRKRVEHPGNPRFWKHANIGPQVDDPADLKAAIEEAWQNFDLYLPKMDAAVEEIFTYTDGKCGERAVDAITNFVLKHERPI